MTKPKKSIATNTAYNLIGGILPILVTLFTVPLFLKQIGAERYGILSIVWLIFGYFSLFDMGISRATANHTAKLKDHQSTERQHVFWTAVSLNLVFGSIGGLLLWLVAAEFGYLVKVSSLVRAEVTSVLPWLALSIPVITVNGALTGTLQGNEKFLIQNVLRVSGSAMLSLIPLTVTYLHGPSLAWVIPAAILTRVAFSFPLWMAAVRTLPDRGFVKPDAHWVHELLQYGSWVMLTNLISPILEAADRMLIGSMIGASSVTAYTIPYNLVDRLRILPSSLSNSIFPRLAAHDRAEATRIASTAIRFLGKAMTLIAGAGILCIHLFLSLWIDPGFAAKSAAIGEIILLGFWINGLAYIPFSLLQSQGRPDLVARFHLFELLPFLGILWLLIHWYGVLGAAMAWTLRVAIDALLLFTTSGLLPSFVKNLWLDLVALTLIGGIGFGLTDNHAIKWIAGCGILVSLTIWFWNSEPRVREAAAKINARISRLAGKKSGKSWSNP